ncbi:hypothetical protein DYB32_009036 [Aphanomyces invadans]|uniref:Retroviral polymerase SH3-like domain-containing protein n=1 Tax=Aphanomyces invadans TaxID=157072 RepID=A0A418AJF3_9STRA|nr:hypothetical protein DYB32_009036 [Aphanomyces invadans]
MKEPEKWDKLTPKAMKCVMMRYAEHQKAYKLYDLEHQKMVTSVHVQFRENEFIGERTPIDEYLITTDDDDDDEDEEALIQGETYQPGLTTTPMTTPRHQTTTATKPRSHF